MFGFFNIKPKPFKAPNEAAFRKGFEKHVPATAVDYVMDLWRKHPFNFKVAGSRKTCLGNYMYKNGRHFISVNGDANPYGFLITLIHEIAHQHVRIYQKRWGQAPAPHGAEWKFHFKTLMAPLLNNLVFPNDILEVLIPHMQNPPASSTLDPQLVKAIGQYSPQIIEMGVYLEELPDGSVFSFKERKFKRVQKRRSRILVECLDTQKQYTIPGIARVEQLN